MSSFAYEPELDQQGMLYFNLSFDAGHSTKMDHNFGFRFDRTYTSFDQVITMNQLNSKPAVFDLKLNSNGLKAFMVNGTDYSYYENVYHGAEGGAKTGTSTNGEVEAQPIPEQTEPGKKIDIPVGVIIGILIGAMALGS